MPTHDDPSPAERRGRSLGALAFGLLVSVPTVLWAAQIINQTFGSPDAVAGMDCRAGLRQLVAGIEQARQSASTRSREREAIEAFRENLGPVWAEPRRVRRACMDTKTGQMMYGRIERLRYAEEHAVRYETRGIAADRQGVERLKRDLGVDSAD